MKYAPLLVPFLASLLAIATSTEALSKAKISSSVTEPATVGTPRSTVEKRNAQTGLGLKKSFSSDSKIAKNVLESKGEGYCSVGLPSV